MVAAQEEQNSNFVIFYSLLTIQGKLTMPAIFCFLFSGKITMPAIICFISEKMADTSCSSDGSDIGPIAYESSVFQKNKKYLEMKGKT